MATQDRSSQKLPQAAKPAAEGEPHLPMGRELTEAHRFAYAALCGVSLAQLFPEPEQRPFCTEFVAGLVKWLDLSEAVLPTMTAFASGLGGEGADMFAQILLKDPILKDDPLMITQDLLSFSLKDGRYDARARVLVCHVTSLLRVPLEELDLLEETFLESLKESKEEESETAEASRKKKENRRKWKRYLLIGLATVGGGTVIGVTGGLAAPLVAAGAATIIGSAGAAALGSVAGIAVMTSLFGAAGAGLTGYKMKKRVGAIEEFTFLPLSEGRQLHITIAITGWLASGKYRTFSAPWAALARSREQYCLAWEAKYLMELGNALETILSGLANMVAQEALKYTVLSGIVAALTWPASLLSVANVIDNPWGVCLHRSAEVGKHLAHILLSRQQGRRPVTLIGFSLGARVIYFCLQEMEQEKDCQGIIEDVVLLGAPVEGEAKHWEPFRKVVSGRIINGYCSTVLCSGDPAKNKTASLELPHPRKGSQSVSGCSPHHLTRVQSGPWFPTEAAVPPGFPGQAGPILVLRLPEADIRPLLRPQGGLAAELRVPHVLRAAPRRRPAARAAAGQEGGKRGPDLRGQRPLGLRQADGHHPEGRGHPHQAQLGWEGALAGSRQSAP
ncbi:transmembrane and coiled-coil domain-containing protein 4 isoform X2 [Camelus bactrianus]|uniref:Transmembrane and coiled-coil domain-containing protein 4 isoform X2 n=1 Tax=Camelus bactrianus TaxID=9837 RepID=A0AC58RFS0_CAMBA